MVSRADRRRHVLSHPTGTRIRVDAREVDPLASGLGLKDDAVLGKKKTTFFLTFRKISFLKFRNIMTILKFYPNNTFVCELHTNFAFIKLKTRVIHSLNQINYVNYR